MLGILRGTTEISGQTAHTLSATAGSVVKATADVGGDVAATAKAAVEGAIQGAKEIGVDAAEAASATATGAIKAAGDISATALNGTKSGDRRDLGREGRGEATVQITVSRYRDGLKAVPTESRIRDGRTRVAHANICERRVGRVRRETSSEAPEILAG